MTDLKRTPLYDEHLKLKARMVPFGGWDMPVQYAGLMKEHEAVRTACGLFDVSHMGEFLVSGPGAEAYLNHVLTNDISKIEDGGCQYTLMCYDNGTVVDDLIVSQINSEKYLLVVNASNIEKDFEWLKSHKPDDVELENLSDDYALIAVQGPKAEKILNIVFGQDFSELKYYGFQGVTEGELFSDGNKRSVSLVSRTGYTGEDGFEVLVPNAQAALIWESLLQVGEPEGLQPAGLGARDTLRLEAAYSLYGHEISDAITGLEAKLGWVIKLTKPGFIGKDALAKEKEEGSTRKIAGFELKEGGVAREGYKVFSSDDQEIGFVTSGTHSPTLKKSIGIVLLQKDFAKVGTEVFVDIRGKKKKMEIVKTPFYKRS